MRTLKSPALVDEAKASRLLSAAKMISLVHSLELAHSTERWNPSEPPSLSRQNCSKKLREAIMFSTCGSYEANRITVSDPSDSYPDISKRTGASTYVDRYVDGWTIYGTPTMWLSKNWRKPPGVTSPPRSSSKGPVRSATQSQNPSRASSPHFSHRQPSNTRRSESQKEAIVSRLSSLQPPVGVVLQPTSKKTSDGEETKHRDGETKDSNAAHSPDLVAPTQDPQSNS
jgi:hypothetical protein